MNSVGWQTNSLQTANLHDSNHPRCDCHDCTQARYVGTFAWQMEQSRRSRELGKQAEPPTEALV